MLKILNKDFYKSSSFYVGIISVISIIISIIIYQVSFNGNLLQYYDSNVLTLSIVGIIGYFALIAFNKTKKLAPIFLWIFTFVSFLQYILAVYMYFTGVFYNGISPEALQLVDPSVYATLFMFLISAILANVAIYLKNSKKEGSKDE